MKIKKPDSPHFTFRISQMKTLIGSDQWDTASLIHAALHKIMPKIMYWQWLYISCHNNIRKLIPNNSAENIEICCHSVIISPRFSSLGTKHQNLTRLAIPLVKGLILFSMGFPHYKKESGSLMEGPLHVKESGSPRMEGPLQATESGNNWSSIFIITKWRS